MSQPPSRLSSALLIRKDQVPDSVKPPMTPPPPVRVTISYRPKQDVRERLRLIAFENRRTVQDLIDEAVEGWLERYQP